MERKLLLRLKYCSCSRPLSRTGVSWSLPSLTHTHTHTPFSLSNRLKESFQYLFQGLYFFNPISPLGGKNTFSFPFFTLELSVYTSFLTTAMWQGASFMNSPRWQQPCGREPLSWTLPRCCFLCSPTAYLLSASWHRRHGHLLFTTKQTDPWHCLCAQLWKVDCHQDAELAFSRTVSPQHSCLC